MKKCMLNNMRLDRLRKDTMYQAVIIDLAVNGVIDKDRAEKVLGYTIPSTIRPLVHDEDEDEEETND